MYLSRNRALSGAAQLRSQTASVPIEPLVLKGEKSACLYAQFGDPRLGTPFTLNFGLNGAASLSATAVGRNSNIQIMSTWPHPSFFGNFLPDSSKVSPEGFSAVWSIPHLARALPHISRDNTSNRARSEASMGVKPYQPTDFYKKPVGCPLRDYIRRTDLSDGAFDRAAGPSFDLSSVIPDDRFGAGHLFLVDDFLRRTG